MTVALATAAVLAGATLQATTGFGFALLAAPVLVAVLGPVDALAVILFVGIELTVLMVVADRSRSSLRPAFALTAWALPGLPVGALLLARLPEEALSVLVSISVLAALFALRPGAVGTPGAPPPRWSLPLAGLTAGALTTSTGTNGPPLVLHLLRASATPAEARRTLAFVFLVLGVLGVAALAIGGILEMPPALALMLVAGLAGRQVGVVLAERQDPERWAASARILLGVSAIALAIGALA